MARYYFNLHDGTDRPDTEGTDFADLDGARAEAVSLLGEMVADIDGKFWQHPEWRLTVVDESGATVCQLEVSGR